MKFLYDFFPLLLFFIGFKLYDIYVATAIAMAASFFQVSWYYWRHRKFETPHLVGLGVITIFGGLTLILQNENFIMWKPTIVYWIMGSVVLASQWWGKKTAIERLLEGKVKLPAHMWARQNLSWGIFFITLGAVNIYVAFFYGLELDADVRQDIWVNFKVFGFLGLTFLFIIVQAVGMAKYMEEPPNTKEEDS